MNAINKTLSGLALVAVIFTGLSLQPRTAKADAWLKCDVANVLKRSSTVYVKCNNSVVLGVDSVIYITIAKTDTAMATRFVSQATSAMLSGKRFWAMLPTATSWPCADARCRVPTEFGIGPL